MGRPPQNYEKIMTELWEKIQAETAALQYQTGKTRRNTQARIRRATARLTELEEAEEIPTERPPPGLRGVALREWYLDYAFRLELAAAPLHTAVRDRMRRRARDARRKARTVAVPPPTFADLADLADWLDAGDRFPAELWAPKSFEFAGLDGFIADFLYSLDGRWAVLGLIVEITATGPEEFHGWQVFGPHQGPAAGADWSPADAAGWADALVQYLEAIGDGEDDWSFAWSIEYFDASREDFSEEGAGGGPDGSDATGPGQIGPLDVPDAP